MTKIVGLAELHRAFRRLERAGQEEVLNKAVLAAAAYTEGAVKVEIRQEDLIDTGFMMNSVYVTGPDKSDYTKAVGLAKAHADREMLSEMDAKPKQAILSVGAEYSRYLHDGTIYMSARPFMLRAFNRTKDKAAQAAAAVMKSELGKLT